MSQQQNTTLEVHGMTCGSCVRHVKQALADVQGVNEVDVRLREGRVVVRHEPGIAPVAVLTAALAEAGYDAASIAA